MDMESAGATVAPKTPSLSVPVLVSRGPANTLTMPQSVTLIFSSLANIRLLGFRSR